jgi:hypothetical protein
MAVASIVLVGVRGIQRSWQRILGPLGYKVRMTGVFYHNSPQVRFTDAKKQPQRCELADLLIVIDHQQAGAAVDRRASLVQAKIAAANGDVPGSATPDQLELLMHWHRFTLPSVYNQNPRAFTVPAAPRHYLMSGSYGGIDLGKPNKLWTQVAPAKVMNTANGCSLGLFLAAMTMGMRGFGRKAAICPAPGAGLAPIQPEDWSGTISELLTLTANSPFSLVLSVGQTRPQRGVTMYAGQIAGFQVAIPRVTLRGWRDGRSFEPPYPGIGDGERGVNALRIELTQDEHVD